jgi:hypothetical protein
MSWLGNLFGGGSNKTTTQATSEPWKAAQPALKLGLNEAQKLFKADKDGSYYSGSTVVPWSNHTQQGMGQIASLANGAFGKEMTGEYKDILRQGGLNDPMKAALGTYGNVVGNGGYNGATRDALAGYNKLQNNPFNDYQKNALRNTQATANGAFNINANPAFQQVLQQAQGAARDSVNMSAGGAGRYGGGVHQGNLASEVGDLTSRMVGNEYNNWQNRKDAATGNLFNMGQTGVNTQMGVNAGIAGLGQGAISNMMNANSARAGLGQQAIGNLGTAYTGLQQPAQSLMQIGAMDEDLATRQMNDKLRLFNDKQQAPWDQIARLNAVASGAGQMGSTTTQSQPGQNPFLTAMGYGATALGGLGSFI